MKYKLTYILEGIADIIPRLRVETTLLTSLSTFPFFVHSRTPFSSGEGKCEIEFYETSGQVYKFLVVQSKGTTGFGHERDGIEFLSFTPFGFSLFLWVARIVYMFFSPYNDTFEDMGIYYLRKSIYLPIFILPLSSIFV